MPSRKVQFAPNEYYHLYGRGVEKQTLFKDERDFVRFLFLILYFQGVVPFHNTRREVTHFVRHQMFNVSTKKLEEVLSSRMVELIAFTIMDNHFHLLVKECEEQGVSRYMQRVLNGFSKYFNTRYEKSGHVFQGPFGATHITTNEQLLHVSAYIHMNQTELKGWKNKEDSYLWSSYTDYLNQNRWGPLLQNDMVLEQFNDSNKYQNFVETSGVKESKP